MHVLAINRGGRSAEPVEVVGTLAAALPLNRVTRGLPGGREFQPMQPDALLVNVGRAEIADEEAVRHGRFGMQYPFLDLPNVPGTPHNSALVPGSLTAGVRQAAEHIRRFRPGGRAA